jgi:hypothetical protein
MKIPLHEVLGERERKQKEKKRIVLRSRTRIACRRLYRRNYCHGSYVMRACHHSEGAVRLVTLGTEYSLNRFGRCIAYTLTVPVFIIIFYTR